MHKTTIYLNERELQQLRFRSVEESNASIASLIRKAIHVFLKEKPAKETFSFLKKQLRKHPSASSFGEAVSYQRSLRKEWK